MKNNLTVYQEIQTHCRNNPKFTAIYYEGKQISYKRFLILIDREAIKLSKLGIKRNDVIMLSEPNIPNVLILYYALNKIGAIADMVHPFTPFDKLKELFYETKCKYAFVFEQRVAKEIDKFAEFKDKVFVSRVEDYLPLFKRIFYHLFMNFKIRRKLNKHSFKYEIKLKDNKGFVETNNDNLKPSLYLHSASTTGESKIIVHNDKSMNFIANHAEEFIGYTKEVTNNKGFLSILPSFHGFGLCMNMHLPLIHDMTVVMVAKFTPNKISYLLNKINISIIVGVPTMYQSLLDNNEFANNKHLSNLLDAYVGGDSLPPLIKDNFDKLMIQKNSKCRLLQGYGLTEAVAVSSLNTLNQSRSNSLGKPISGVDIKIVNSQGIEVPSKTIGEIIIKSESIMLGYYNDENATKECMKDGYLYTGDLGYIDEDGYLFFTSRKKRVIKVSGVMVFPNEVERFILSNFPTIKECAAIETNDEKLGHAIKIVVSPFINDEQFEQIKNKCKDYLIRWSIPKSYTCLETLPKTMYNKIDYRALEKEFN